ncbi:MAG: cytochrome B [Sphingobacteriaceae bacterium]|nr:cytochrome B [Sphingobacteriaceae bacterium]
MNLYTILRSAHSGWRYIVLAMLIVAVVVAILGWFGKKEYTEGNRKLNLFTLIAVHLQITFGLIIYFISPLVEAGIRYWKMEHVGMMVFSAILVTIGNARSKKEVLPQGKHRTITIYFGLALLVIMVSIFQMTKVGPLTTFWGMTH